MLACCVGRHGCCKTRVWALHSGFSHSRRAKVCPAGVAEMGRQKRCSFQENRTTHFTLAVASHTVMLDVDNSNKILRPITVKLWTPRWRACIKNKRSWMPQVLNTLRSMCIEWVWIVWGVLFRYFTNNKIAHLPDIPSHHASVLRQYKVFHTPTKHSSSGHCNTRRDLGHSCRNTSATLELFQESRTPLVNRERMVDTLTVQ